MPPTHEDDLRAAYDATNQKAHDGGDTEAATATAIKARNDDLDAFHENEATRYADAQAARAAANAEAVAFEPPDYRGSGVLNAPGGGGATGIGPNVPEEE